jgi:hypothetical protein
LAKKNLRHPLKKRLKNSGTRYAPKFLERFLFEGFCRYGIREKKQKRIPTIHRPQAFEVKQFMG